MKDNCQLFAKKKLSIEEKVKNIELLLDTRVINNGCSRSRKSIDPTKPEIPLYQLKMKWIFHYHLGFPKLLNLYLVCVKMDFIHEVIVVETDKVHLNFLMAKYKLNDAYLKEERMFWIWLGKVDHQWLNKKGVMEICAVLPN